MADISAEISAFQNAVYGEDVRGSMVSLANKLNTEISNTVDNTDEIINNYEDLSNSVYMLPDIGSGLIKTQYIKTNLIQISKLINNSLLNTNGAEIIDNNYYRTDYIPVKPNTNYKSLSGTNRYVWFDSNKQYISHGSSNSEPLTTIRTSPLNAAYIIMCFEKSSFPDPYQVSFIEVSDSYAMLDYEALSNAVSRCSPALYGIYIASITSNGTLNFSFNNYRTTSYILILNSSFTYYGFYSYAVYDSNKELLYAVRTDSSENQTQYIMDERAKYIRICFHVNDSDDVFINWTHDILHGIKATDNIFLSKNVKILPSSINGWINHNLIQPYNIVENVYINWYDGGTKANSNYYSALYIPVEPNTLYKGNYGRNYAWYDSSKIYISGVAEKIGGSVLTSPDNAAYISITYNRSDDINDFSAIYFAKVSEYNPNELYLRFDTAPSWCSGMKINWIGDSIIADADWDEFVSRTLNLIETDYGIGGSTIALKSDGTNPRNAIILRYLDMTDDADIIAVSAGTNDFQYSIPTFGDITSTDNTSFYGALKNLCEGLINKYPQKVIFFTTPIKRAQPFNGTDTPTNPFSTNECGKTLKDYRDAIIEVCGYYSIPVLDLWGESMLNPHLSSQANMFDSALTHPNDAGRKLMARRAVGWIRQLGANIS